MKLYEDVAKEQQVNNKGEDTTMTTDFGTQDILTGRGLGLGGFGYGQGYGPYASPATNAVRLERNAQMGENQADFTREVLKTDIDGVRQSFENLTRDNQFASLTKTIADASGDLNDRIVNSEFRNSDRIVNGEFRNSDRLRDIEREMNANARAAANCCCETQKEIIRLDASNNLKFAELKTDICGVESRLSTQINQIDARSIERALNASNAELTALKTQVACGCCPPSPHHHGGC